MQRRTKKWMLAVLSTALTVSLAACGGTKETGKGQATAAASNYPEKAITLVAPNGAGGGLDKTARLLAKGLADTKLVTKTVLVENRPGGGGSVYMAEYATKETKNPYKLLVNSPPVLLNNHKKEGNSPYGYKDTTPLAQLTRDYGAISVPSDSKYKDLKSLLDDIKADPTQVTIAGGSSPGSMDHVIAMLPIYKYGLDPKRVKYVAYEGGGESITALLGNHAQAAAKPVSLVLPYLEAKKIRVLAVTSPERLGGILSDVPTMKELGLDAEFTIWRGVLGPKEMGEAEVAYWDKTFKALSEKEEWKQLLKADGVEGDYKNSKDFKAFLDEQDKQIEELLKAIGIHK
ncbi:tripartite tricarboxylate transporter substrate binding protein [Brevibacillus brevis]|uniref:Bug family tripartite tricarboxylate transporter substrate binding protein n=1 Tax=Brevibacillus brevis TaxID=1393 RepID=UPI001C8ECDD5|nr:tripartite tricarboxylate transporter substrate binding protein [Brevibacillus brevis]MBY0088946.1 tripartite tricarboxylate transporter substrate binding protein [Brevibacillus brevis]